MSSRRRLRFCTAAVAALWASVGSRALFFPVSTGAASGALRTRSATVVPAAAAALGVFAFGFGFGFGAAFCVMAGLSKPSWISVRLFCAMFVCICSSYSLLGRSSSAATTASAASPIVAVELLCETVFLLDLRF